MRDSAPHRLTERRQAILRQTSAALRGQPVMLCRVAKGIAVAEVASPPNPPRDVIEFDVAAALRTWGGEVGDRSLWWDAASSPAACTWAGARATCPPRPPNGADRPSPDRLCPSLAGP